MFDVTATGIGTFVGAFLAAFGVNAVRSFLRLDGQLKYWKAKAEGNESHVDGSEGKIFGDPVEEMENRINEKLHHLEMRTGCEFSEIFQGHIKCTHDVISNQHLTSKELISAVDDCIVGMAQLSQLLRSVNGKLRIENEQEKKGE